MGITPLPQVSLNAATAQATVGTIYEMPRACRVSVGVKVTGQPDAATVRLLGRNATTGAWTEIASFDCTPTAATDPDYRDFNAGPVYFKQVTLDLPTLTNGTAPTVTGTILFAGE